MQSPTGGVMTIPRRAMRRFRPPLIMVNKLKRPQLIPVLLLFLFLIFVLRQPKNFFLDTTAPPTRIARPDFNLPPLRVTIIASPNTTAADILRTLETLPEIPITLHHFGSDVALHNLTYDRVIEHTIHTSRRPYEDPLRVLHPPALYLRAGTRLASAAIPWLTSARDMYANRPDIAGFSLAATVPSTKGRGPDHKPSSWRSVSSSSPFAYELLESGEGFFPNFAPNLAVWETFSEWLLLRRSDWYRYPSGEGVDGTPLGISELPERNWTRGAWNVWFSKYLSEYKLRVVYPGPGISSLIARGGEATPPGEGSFEMGELDIFDSQGKPVKGGMYKPETVNQIVNLGMRQGGVVSFTMVNKVFLDTARSWLCNVDVAKIRPRGLLWAVTDRETEEEMRKVEGSEVVMLDEVQGGKETGHDFGNPGYWRLMLERTALIGEILRQGIALFAFETDAIWLEDPQPYIDELVWQDADIVGTINTKQEVSGNFFYLRPTLATRRLWDEITERFSSAYHATNWTPKASNSWTYIENDQSQLTKLVLRNDTWRRSYPLSFLTLDMELFVDGRWYNPEKGFYTSKRAREPVVVNNNFAIGVKEKTERAEKVGHWFWDEKEKQCLADVVNKAVRKSRKR